MKHKVLHISPTDIRYDSRILKELKAVYVMDNTNLFSYGIEEPENKKKEINALNYIKTYSLFSKKFKFLPRSIRYFINFIEAFFVLIPPGIKYNPKVIHCHDTLFLPIAVIIKFFCQSFLIYDAHELESKKAGQNKILSKFTLAIEKFSWKHIDFLIGVSPSIIDWYDMHLGKKPSEIILNSPSIDSNVKLNFNVKNNYLRDKFDISNECKIFIYLGILTKEGRGIEYYLNVFTKKDVNSHLVFIGYGPYAEEIKKYANENDNIHYHESVKHDQVVSIAKSADVGLCLIENVSLSDYYCLPNKLFEYAFANLFVLSSDFPDIQRIVNRYSLGMCAALNEGSIYNAVIKIQNQEIIQSKNSLESLYDLSWDYQHKKLSKLYGEIFKK